MKAGRVSSTAIFVAGGVYLVSQEPRYQGLVAPETGRLLGELAAAASPIIRKLLPYTRHHWFRRACWFMESKGVPGILLHLALRKRRIADTARAALGTGIRQVVVLGAGLDPLGQQLAAECPEVRCWELDHPSTQRVKAGLLGSALPTGLRLLPRDLQRGSLAATLTAREGYSREEATFFAAEGLLMYLSPQRVRALLRSMAQWCGPESLLVFTFMEPQPEGGVHFRGQHPLVTAWLRLRGEPMLWGVPRGELEAFLRECGWGLVALYDHQQDRRDFLRGEAATDPLPDGDLVCVAAPLPRQPATTGEVPCHNETEESASRTSILSPTALKGLRQGARPIAP